MSKLLPFINRLSNDDKQQIIKKFPKNYNNFVDPFVGYGDILLKLKPTKAIISDPNPDIVNVWRSVKVDPERFVNHIKRFTTFTHKQIIDITIYLANTKTYTVKRAAYFLLNQVNFVMKNSKKNVLNSSEQIRNIYKMSVYLNKNKIRILYLNKPKKINKKTKPKDIMFLDATKRNDKNILEIVRGKDKKVKQFIIDEGDLKKYGLDMSKYNIERLSNRRHKVIMF